MGKSKSKKSKPVAESSSAAIGEDLVVEPSGQVSAIDGHNTTGWTDKEIKAYNDLIVERHKLEAQRSQLEEKCAKSQTQRALLNEDMANIESVFRPHESLPGLLVYTGSSSCCVDLDLESSECQHELCLRAKRDGISCAELDHLKYYTMRVSTEKSDRVKTALRKQRDIELGRIRKEEADERAHSARKVHRQSNLVGSDSFPSAGCGSRAYNNITELAAESKKAINKLIAQLKDLGTDLQASRISAEDAQCTFDMLDRAFSHGRGGSGQTKVIDGDSLGSSDEAADPFRTAMQVELRNRLLGASGDTFAQAFSILNHFLSATTSGDLQDAISELKDVLQLAGPLGDDFQKSLGALEGIFDSPERLAFIRPDGKQECSNSIMDLMGKLKDSLKETGKLPDGSNAGLAKVFQDCIAVEEDARSRLAEEASSSTSTTSELQTILTKVKDQHVGKSPIPMLTSNKLDAEVVAHLDIYDAHRLLKKACSGVGSQELEAQITSQVISRSPRRPEMYIETLKRLEAACHGLRGDESARLLAGAFSVVLAKMESKFKPRSTDKAGASSGASTENVVGNSSASRDGDRDVTQKSSESEELPTIIQARDKLQFRSGSELLPTFNAYCASTWYEADRVMWCKVTEYPHETEKMASHMLDDPELAVKYLYDCQFCPALSGALLAQSVSVRADSECGNVLPYVQQIAKCIDVSAPSVPEDWVRTFRQIVLAMMDIYVAVYVEASLTLNGVKANQFAVFAINIFSVSIHLSRTKSQAVANLAVIAKFLHASFGLNRSDGLSSPLDSALMRYGFLCQEERFKCTTTLSCSEHMTLDKERSSGDPKPYSTGLILRAEETALYLQANMSGGATTKQWGLPLTTDSSGMNQQQAEMDTGFNLSRRTRYRPHESNGNWTRDLDARFADSLTRAAVLHESTAKKALALLHLRADHYEVQKLLPPTELVLTMDQLLNVARDDYHHPIKMKDGRARRSIHSKFAEHLDETLIISRKNMYSILAIQNTFKTLRTGSSEPARLEEYSDKLKALAMSGQFASPVQFIDQHRARLGSFGKLPDCLVEAYAKVQNQILRECVQIPTKQLWESKRLIRLLAMVDETVPSAFALFQLATSNPHQLDEYYNIISGQFSLMNGIEARELDDLWSKVRKEAYSRSLNQDSDLLAEVAGYAMQDWDDRVRSVINHPDNKTEQYSKLHPHFDEYVDSTENGHLVAFSSGPAKQPKIESGTFTPEPISGESSAVLIEPSLQPVEISEFIADMEQTNGNSKIGSVQEVEDTGSNNHCSTVLQAQTPAEEASLVKVNHLENNVLKQDTGLSSTENLHPTDMLMIPTAEVEAINTNISDQVSSPPANSVNTLHNSTSSDSIHQRDAERFVAAMAASAQASAELTKLVASGEHEGPVEGVGPKLTKFVSTCRDMVEWLAELKRNNNPTAKTASDSEDSSPDT